MHVEEIKATFKLNSKREKKKKQCNGKVGDAMRKRNGKIDTWRFCNRIRTALSALVTCPVRSRVLH
jgi:hypothetical protein